MRRSPQMSTEFVYLAAVLAGLNREEDSPARKLAVATVHTRAGIQLGGDSLLTLSFLSMFMDKYYPRMHEIGWEKVPEHVQKLMEHSREAYKEGYAEKQENYEGLDDLFEEATSKRKEASELISAVASDTNHLN